MCKGLFINDVITAGGGGGLGQKMTHDDMMTKGGVKYDKDISP